MSLSEEAINEIAQKLSSGLACYIHKKSLEIISIPNPLGEFSDFEGWEDQHEKLEKEKENFLEILPMASRKSFLIMEDFAEQVTDQNVKDKLLNALRGGKPFRRFRNVLDADTGDFLNDWYTYRDRRYKEWVKGVVEAS